MRCANQEACAACFAHSLRTYIFLVIPSIRICTFARLNRTYDTAAELYYEYVVLPTWYTRKRTYNVRVYTTEYLVLSTQEKERSRTDGNRIVRVQRYEAEFTPRTIDTHFYSIAYNSRRY